MRASGGEGPFSDWVNPANWRDGRCVGRLPPLRPPAAVRGLIFVYEVTTTGQTAYPRRPSTGKFTRDRRKEQASAHRSCRSAKWLGCDSGGGARCNTEAADDGKPSLQFERPLFPTRSAGRGRAPSNLASDPMQHHKEKGGCWEGAIAQFKTSTDLVDAIESKLRLLSIRRTSRLALGGRVSNRTPNRTIYSVRQGSYYEYVL